MTLWEKSLLFKCTDQNFNPQHPQKCWTGMGASCNPSTQEAETEDPRSKLSS